MKICPVCQMGNSDDRVICRECDALLGAVTAQDEETILKAESEKYDRWDERRQRTLRIQRMAGGILSAVLHVSFFVISNIRGNFFFVNLLLLFMPAAGYLMIVKAEKMFEIEVIASNDFEFVGEVRPSEYYLAKNFIRGAALMVGSVILMGIIAFR